MKTEETKNTEEAETRTHSKSDAPRTNSRRRIRRVIICAYDKDKNMQSHIHYMNYSLLSSMLNDRGFIRRSRGNKLCAKHQRLARRMIIIARSLHLLPYISL